MRTWIRRIVGAIVVLAIVGGIVYALIPKPIPVDIATAAVGPLVVTVDEEGKTRVRERYTVSAPLAGELNRIQLKEGAPLAAGQTLLAVIQAMDPSLLDARTRAEAEARVKSAEVAVRHADTSIQRAQAALEYAQAEYRRGQQLLERNTMTQDEFENRQLLVRTRVEDLEAAQLSGQIAEFELELARAALLTTQPESANSNERPRLEIHSPIDGRVLRVLEESATIVSVGTPLIEVGDPTDLEIVVDVLSNDAVRIRPGARVLLEHWGGDAPLEARVRIVEPSAYTKISALGVEEQRVDVIADLTAPPDAWDTLGDGYRVEARIVTWESDSVLKVPTSALFRDGDRWSVFVVEDGRAQLRPIELGHRNPLEAEIRSGLTAGEQVIVHPSDQIHSGVRITQR